MAVAVKKKSFLDGIPDAPPDPILSLRTLYEEDPAEKKLNVSVGAYRTDEGKSYILPVVKEVEAMMLEDPSMNHEYLPVEGLKEFRDATAKLAFGEDSLAIREGRCVTVQALSGTGALRVGLEFLSRFYKKGSKVFVPEQSWPLHRRIPPLSGMGEVDLYRYFNADTKGVDFTGLVEDISNAPNGSIIVLHPCAHNPTGADLNFDEWKQLCTVIAEKGHLPFFDAAYQGFATGDLIRDRFALEYFASQGIELMLSQSYAKNMGLYGERTGALSVIVSDKSIVDRVLVQLKQVIRPMYSSPPAHGARIAATILNNPVLFDKWNGELKLMSGRILEMRTALKLALQKLQTPGSWDFLEKQIGMFSYTGLTGPEVDFIQEKYHIYMMRNGRISMAGLTTSTVDYLAGAMHDAVLNAPKSHL
uniref:aspartate transaminase n=3 Tax=Rhodosorus marinus TaxID=101924 RepID=A0A7S2ZC68_9RHOD|mmetsp:Transcript_14191/g.57176  ORF Transcript_14191/g.57176 Transcript_14191/m.57176 type:complete len:418 (+) Transcript_14191:812-2065(+)